MNPCVILVILASLVLRGEAEPLTIQFSTLPPDCTVASTDSPERPAALGGITVERPKPGQALHFRLFKPGFHSLQVEIPEERIPPGSSLVWPSKQGSFLRLDPMLINATFMTSPAGAQIWVSASGQTNDYLGVTGEPVLLNLANLSGPADESFFRVSLVAPGYRTVEVPIPRHLFGDDRPNRWPPEGEYALAPTQGLLAPIVFFFRMTPWSGGLLLLTLIGAFALLARLAQRARRAVERARFIESRSAKSGEVLAGSRLGAYRLFEVLGKGASATVFRAALDHEDGSAEELAIKVFHWRQGNTERLTREVKALLELRHPNLVGLLDWGQHDGFAYLVTELIAGRTLRQELEHGRLSLERWQDLADELLLGLFHAHQRGVIHGDVKPENILLPWHGKLKLVDFGLSRHLPQRSSERLGGTPGYMAPELAGLSCSTALSDQYAVGTTLFEALYGVFPGCQVCQASRHLELERVLLKMRDSDPAKRFSDLASARRSIAACLSR